MKIKICSRCKEEKEINEFYKDMSHKDLLTSFCKVCKNTINKKYRDNNGEKIKQHGKKYYQLNKENIDLKNREWVRHHPLENKVIKDRYIKNNPEVRKKSRTRWYKNNLGYHNEYNKEKRKSSIHFRLRYNISSLISSRLKNLLLNKRGKSTLDILPYTIDELKKHLEHSFEFWMNWNNYGNGKGKWNIDHIRPDCSFNYKSVEDEEFQKCWALENLRPLDAIENIKKGNKILN